MLLGKMQAVSRVVFYETDEVKTTFVATSGRRLLLCTARFR
jgi:hypothetical protein